MLTDLADVLRAGAHGRYDVVEIPGWRTRRRVGVSFPDGRPLAIICHHTASRSTSHGRREAEACAITHEVAPVCNLYLFGRTFWVCAAGASNTNGAGGPLGPLPKDSANSRVIGIEAGNDGVGEPWSPDMLDAYIAGVSVLALAYGIPAAHVYAHHEWAPTRKIDPAGPARYAQGGDRYLRWDMAAFRNDVATAMRPVIDPLPPVSEEDDMPARYLVQHPTNGRWYVTDTATYKTHVPEPSVGRDGIAVFGWVGKDDDEPILLGPDWGRLIDSLPTNGSG